MKPFLCLFFLFCSSFANEGPLVGIMAQPYTESGSDYTAYIPSSYVEWIESGSGRVIPIFPDMTYNELQDILLQLNGVLFTGGAAPTDPRSSYEKAVINVLNIVREFHENNPEYSIPIWGTCDGFENIMTGIADTESVMGSFDATEIPLPIKWNDNVYTSQMFNIDSFFANYSSLVINIFGTQSSSYNDHSKGITPTTFNNNPAISSNFTLLGTSFDRNGKEFVTLIESKKELGLNIYASQFHPEKISFEFKQNDIPHQISPVIANQYLAQFFINVCSYANNNTMSDDKYNELIIYNYNTTNNNSNLSPYFEDVYMF